MIRVPTGWFVERDASSIVLAPKTGGGIVRYSERVRPLDSLHALINQALEPYEVLAASSPVLMETDEGEYAARLSAEVEIEGHLVQKELGFVLIDDFYSLIDATVLDASCIDEFCGAVDRLTRTDAHGLGARRRWYRLVEPAGWRMVSRGRERLWFPNDGRSVVITAWHAEPRSSGACAAVLADTVFGDDFAAGYTLLGASPESPVSTENGLSGSTLRSSGQFPDMPVTERIITALEDTRYVYGLKLEALGCLADEDVATYEKLVRSIEPIPGAPAATDAFLHWAA